MKPSSFEDVLDQVGSTGRHQVLLIILFAMPLNFIIPWIVFGPIFFSSTPAHHCSPPPLLPGGNGTSADAPFLTSEDQISLLVELNYTDELWARVAIPRPGGEADQCHQLDLTWDDVASLSATHNATNSSHDVIDCRYGYTYDTTDFVDTLTSSLGWVCDSERYTAMWLSVGLAGNVFGTLIFTPMSDIYGRRLLLTLACLLFGVFGSLRIYMTSTVAVMLAHFVASMPFPATLELCLIIVMEQVSPTWRSYITCISFMMWTAGMCVLPLLAWLAASWKVLCIATSLPFAVIAASYWVLPESPSWLLSRGRVADTAELLTTIARRNGRTVPSNLQEQLSMLTSDRKAHFSPLQLLQTPTVRKRTLLLTASYACNNLFYYGLAFNLGNMSGNQFLNFFLFGISETPANILGCWMAEKLGRRWSQALAFLLASAFAVAAVPLLGSSYLWAPTALLTVSKLFVTISFFVVYIQCAEIYPTTHRGSGTGMSSIISSCFGTTAPYIAYMSRYWDGFPYMIMALIGCLGIAVSSMLPETLGVDLPQNVEDAEIFLLDQKYFSFMGTLCGSSNAGVVRANSIKETSDGYERANTKEVSERPCAESVNSATVAIMPSDPESSRNMVSEAKDV